MARDSRRFLSWSCSQRDLAPDEAIEREVAEWRDDSAERAVGVLAVSAVTGAGIDELRREILSNVPEDEPGAQTQRAAAEPSRDGAPRLPATGVGGFAVEREDGGAFRVEGRGTELLVRRHDSPTIRPSPTSSSGCARSRC